MRGGIPGPDRDPDELIDAILHRGASPAIADAFDAGRIRIVRTMVPTVLIEGDEEAMTELGLLADRMTAVPTNLLDEAIDELTRSTQTPKRRALISRLRALLEGD